MDWLGIVGYLAWPLVFLAGHWVAGRKPAGRTLAMEAPPQDDTGRFLVVARVRSGARARQIFERATVGESEAVELWDGPTCRGRKGPTEG